MRDKPRFIKKKSNLNKIVFIIIFIFFITIGVGYSYLKQSLDIFGKATIISQTVTELKSGNSQYSWNIDNVIEEDLINYEVTLNVINLDKDYNTYILSFDVPESFVLNKSEVDNSAQMSYENDRVIIKSNSFIAKNDELKLKLKLCFKDNQNFYIDNLALNGYLAINK